VKEYEFRQRAAIALLSNESFIDIVKKDHARYTLASFLAEEVNKIVSELHNHKEKEETSN